MVVIKLRENVFAYVKDGEWHAEDPMDLEMLDSFAPYNSSPAVGDVDAYMADLAVTHLGVSIERVENPPKFDPKIIY